MSKSKTPYLDRALTPRDIRGLLQPMSFPGGVDGAGNPVYYPVLPQPPNGSIEPMLFEEDFRPGGKYSSLSYAPGFCSEPFGLMPTGFVNPLNPACITFTAPFLNLPGLNREIRRSGVPPEFLPAAQQLSSLLTSHGILPALDDSEPEFEVLHLPNAKGQKVRICNCNIQVEALRSIVSSKQQDYEISLKLIRQKPGSLPICTEICVPESKLTRLADFLGNQFPWFVLASETPGAANLLCEYIRDQLDSVPRLTVFRSVGWHDMNGRHVYIHDGLPESKDFLYDCGQRIIADPSLSPAEAFQAALEILDIGNLDVTLPLMLTALTGPLFYLLETAGYTPRFCTFLHGLSGSLKTSTAKVFYQFFSGGQHHSFCDTAAAVDVGITQHRDRLFLIDDFRPAVIAAEGSAMRKTLEHVVRLFGDDVSKKRANSHASAIRGKRPRCSCLITGEATAGSYSSLLRNLLVPITRGDIDPERLQRYQENPALWSTVFTHFLPWVGDNWDHLSTLIRQEFPSWRSTFSQITREPRLADIGAILALVGKIFLDYGVFCRSIDASCAQSLLSDWCAVIQHLLAASTVAAQELDVAELTREAISSALVSGSLRLAPNANSFTIGMDGFESDNRVWIHPESLQRILQQYYTNTSTVGPCSLKAILPELYHRGMVLRDEEANKNSFLKRAYLPALKERPRMICFIRTELFSDQ